MNINIRGDKIVVTDSIKKYVIEKLSKLDKYFDDAKNINCHVLIKVKNENQTVEVTIPTSKFTLRAEESRNDLYAAIDVIEDKLERMIRKNKTKLSKHYKDASNFEMNFNYEELPEEEEEKIVKRKTLESKPMDEDEALMQMDLLNHDFFVFKNTDEDCISVIYKRKDNNYGIINVK